MAGLVDFFPLSYPSFKLVTCTKLLDYLGNMVRPTHPNLELATGAAKGRETFRQMTDN